MISRWRIHVTRSPQSKPASNSVWVIQKPDVPWSCPSLFSWGLFPRLAQDVSVSDQNKQELERGLWPWPDSLSCFSWFLTAPSAEPRAKANDPQRKNSVLTSKGWLSDPHSTTNCLWASGRHLCCPFYLWLFTVQSIHLYSVQSCSLVKALCTSSWLAYAVCVLVHHGPCSSMIVPFPKDLSPSILGIH